MFLLESMGLMCCACEEVEDEDVPMALLREVVPSVLLGEEKPIVPLFLTTSNELREPGWILPDTGAGLFGMGEKTLDGWRRWLAEWSGTSPRRLQRACP